MPSLVQLEYIVAVADLKHFGKAAEACHISQPTLSQQIRKVEGDLDIVIFDRVKKPIVLTEDGEAILHQARLILREHKRLKELARQKSDEIAGEFRLEDDFSVLLSELEWFNGVVVFFLCLGFPFLDCGETLIRATFIVNDRVGRKAFR